MWIALNLDEEKPAIRVVAGASSRDWIGIAVAANLLNEVRNNTYIKSTPFLYLKLHTL